MTSALAAQLAQGASLNATLVAGSGQRRKAPAQSYLFTGREADKHDLESVHALGANGIAQLRTLDKRFTEFEESLFGEAAKSYDRTLRTKEENAKLDGNVEAFLVLLSPWVLEAPAGKVLEWLVRRFRINEFNVDPILAQFLPYHESPHFAKMLTILHISPQSVHAYLLPTKSTTLPLSPQTLLAALAKSPDLLRFVCALLPRALVNGTLHRTLIAFTTSTLLGFLTRVAQGGKLDEGALAVLVPALVAPLKGDHTNVTPAVLRDAQLSSYILLGALSRASTLAPTAVGVVLTAMTVPITEENASVMTSRFVRAALAFSAPQETVNEWSSKAARALLAVPHFAEVIKDALTLVGSEKLFLPLVPALIDRSDAEHNALISFLITSPSTPQAIIHSLASTLLKSVLSSQAEDNVASDASSDNLLAGLHRGHLRALQERRPSIFQTVLSSARQNGDEDALDALIRSLAMPAADVGQSAQMDVVSASLSADAEVRRVGVRDMLKALSAWAGVDSDESDTLKSALLARLQDTDVRVLGALYAEPAILKSLISADLDVYIDTLATALHTPDDALAPARGVIRAHIDFLAQHALASAPEEKVQEAFEKVAFPFLLASKSRAKTARAIWAAIATDGSTFMKIPLIAGMCEAWVWEAGKERKEKIEEEKALAKANVGVAARMGELVVALEEYERHVSFLLKTLSSPLAHARGLAFLTIRAILARLSGLQQLALAVRVLKAFGSLSSFEDVGEDASVTQDDASLGTSLFAKPRGAHTLARLRGTLLLLLARTPCPASAALHLFAPAKGEEGVGALYALFARELYTRAASTTGASALNVQRALFATLGAGALTFLAGIWSSPSIGDGETGVDASFVVQHAALAHTVAFLAAHLSLEAPPDFQVVLPALIGALQHERKEVREAAAECVTLLARLAKARTAEGVYALETIYGHASDELVFLEWPDFGRYLDAIVEHRDHFVADGGAIGISAFHGAYLRKSRSDTKKEAAHKARVLGFLLAHVNACPVLDLRVWLLRALAGVTSAQKAEVLVQSTQSAVQRIEEVGDSEKDYVSLLLATLDLSVTTVLNEVGSPFWNVFISAIRKVYSQHYIPGAHAALAQNIEHGVYAALNENRKLELVQALLTLSSEGDETYNRCKKTLDKVLTDIPTITQLLIVLRPSPYDATPRAAKRAKLDLSTAEQPDDSMARLVLLAEVLASQSLPTSVELVSCLLETINAVLHADSANTDVAYLQQLLMAAIENVTTKMNPSDVKSGSLRLEILVELIRLAVNPQTFNQALLLISSLSRLAPEAVLHHIMPVFTFMGSNVFHRDDSYSFRVVEQTIDNTVPVMVSSLKLLGTDRLTLYVAARDFLRIFSDAANHIPRHRRTNFFAHLVDVLGARDFLAPICMLLVSKVATRVVKQEILDVQNTLALPTSILHRQSPELQVEVLSEVLEESRRLVANVLNPDRTGAVFLNDPSDDESSIALSTATLRRAQALILFVANALRQSPSGFLAQTDIKEGAVETILSKLLDLSSPEKSSTKEFTGVIGASQVALSCVLKVSSVVEFIQTVALVLQSGVVPVQAGVLQLLAERLPLVSVTARASIASNVARIVQYLADIVSSNSSTAPITQALDAVRVIAETMAPGEEAALVALMPVLVKSIRDRKNIGPTFAALEPLPVKLGPRLIPHFRELVQESVSIVREAREGKDYSASTAENAIGVLSGLLVSIPTFWGKAEIVQVIKLYVDGHVDTLQASLGGLVKSMTKRLAPKSLLTTMCDAWTTLQIAGSDDSVHRFSAFFQVLRRCLRVASRSDVVEQLRPLSRMLIESFDRRSNLKRTDVDEGEIAAIAAFVELTVKLNEASFRPLFRKIFDWAFVDSISNVYKKITFCNIYIGLLDYFKNLMTSYSSFLLQPFSDILRSYAGTDRADRTLWVSMLNLLTKSFTYDEGIFWRDEKLRQIAAPLIDQVLICAKMNEPEAKTALTNCLVTLGEAASDDMVLKTTNLSLLMHTRSDDARLRILALSCAEALWKAHGGKLLGFAAETATFIFECAEDENDSVAQEAFKLKNAVESVTGSISGL